MSANVTYEDLNRGQRSAIDEVIAWLDVPYESAKLLSLSGPAGCHAPGAEVIDVFGNVRRVEDIAVGDRLLGPDSTPRKVLSLVRGFGEMVEVVPVKGDPFVVNKDHILTLRRSCGTGPLLVDISVREWLGWSNNRKHEYKLWRTGVDFLRASEDEPPFVIEPYFLGLLLGDGGMLDSISVSKPDPEILTEVNRQAEKFNLRVRTYGESQNPHHKMFALQRGSGRNALINSLRFLELYPIDGKDKFVPNSYKVAGRDDRLSILAGLLDSDGSLSFKGFDFINKSRRLAADLCFIARSCGFAAYLTPCVKSCQTGAVGNYYRVSVSGDTDKIPTKIGRKQAQPRQQVKNVGHTGFSIRDKGHGEFFGFTLSGDGRYLMSDFTVTHNCGKTTLLKLLADRLDSLEIDVVWAAMTGRAARRMREVGLHGATTLHAALYDPPREIDNKKKKRIDLEFDQFKDTVAHLLVVDEASMIDRKMLADIERGSFVKILLVGDHVQIPPVSKEGSDSDDWSVFGAVRGPVLTEVMRTSGAIVDAATLVRERCEIPAGVLESESSRYDFSTNYQQAIKDWFDDRDDHVLVTWKNEVRMNINRQIRQVLGYSGPLMQPGEPVVIRKNDHKTSMMNGDVYFVDEWLGDGPQVAGIPTRYLRLRTDQNPPLPCETPEAIDPWSGTDYKTVLVVMGGRDHGAFDGFVPYVGLKEWNDGLVIAGLAERKPDGGIVKLKEPLPITYAYCLTGHLVQGSEYRRVTTLLFDSMNNRNFRKPTRLPDGSTMKFAYRWLYTSITRGKKRSTVVG